MATCKDCIHYEACRMNTHHKTNYERFEEKYKKKIDSSNCSLFKDRSKVVELPCKVGKNGDIFWAVESYGISPYRCLGIKYGYDCLEGDNTLMLLAVGGREYIFGKEAFFHEEEAEQALRERN